jgi:hypothetical protein
MRPRTLGRPLAPRYPRRAAGRRSAARSSRVARRVSPSLKAPPCSLSAVRPRTPLARAALPRAPTCAASACAALLAPRACALLLRVVHNLVAYRKPLPPPHLPPARLSPRTPLHRSARPPARFHARAHARGAARPTAHQVHALARGALGVGDVREVRILQLLLRRRLPERVCLHPRPSRPRHPPRRRMARQPSRRARSSRRAAAAGAPRLRRRWVRGSTPVWGMEHAGRAGGARQRA